MPLNINKIMSSSIDQLKLSNFKKVGDVKSIIGGVDLSKLTSGSGVVDLSKLTGGSGGVDLSKLTGGSGVVDISKLTSGGIGGGLDLSKLSSIQNKDIKSIIGGIGGSSNSPINSILGGDLKINDILKNNIGGSNSPLSNLLPDVDLSKINNLNIDTNKVFSNLNLISNLGIDNSNLKNDFLKLSNSGIKFNNLNDLKKLNLTNTGISKEFLSNLEKIQSNGIEISSLSDSLSKLGSIKGVDKLLNMLGNNNLSLLGNNNLKDKLSNFLNKDKSDKSDKNPIKADPIKLPNPGEVINLDIRENQLSLLESELKNSKFSKLFGDEYKSVTALISTDANISKEGDFIGKYVIAYVTGQKNASWDISKNDAIAKINIDQSKISLSADYNKNVDGVTHHIRITLLKNVTQPTTKTEVKNDENPTTVTKIEKNLYIDRERGIKILVPSQYIDVYQTSKWGGYPSFTTTKFSRQMVWYDKSYDRPDYYPTNITKPATKNRDGRSNFDINVHIGQPGGKSVGNWSDDGSHCFENADAIKEFFEICEKHIELYGNKFSYTLATKDDYDKAYRDDQIAKEERRKKEEEEAKQRALLQQQQQNTSTNTSTTNNTSDLSVSTPANTNKEADKPASDCPNYDCWSHYGKENFWNGVNTIGGKKVPAIVIEKSNSYFKISYKGASYGFLLKHAKGGKSDTIHQLLNVLTLELNPYMLSNKLKPDVDNIQMYLKSNSLVVGVPLMKSPSGIAYTIKRRGGLNHYGDTSDLKPFEKRKEYKYKMVVSGSSGWKLTEHFITFEGPE